MVAIIRHLHYAINPCNCSFPRCLSQIFRGLTNHLQPLYGMNWTIAWFCKINNNNNILLGFRYNKTCFSRPRRYLLYFHLCLGLPKSRSSLGWYWKSNSGRWYCSILATFFYNLLSALERLRKATISFVMSVRLFAWNNSAATGWILMKFEI